MFSSLFYLYGQKSPSIWTRELSEELLDKLSRLWGTGSKCWDGSSGCAVVPFNSGGSGTGGSIWNVGLGGGGALLFPVAFCWNWLVCWGGGCGSGCCTCSWFCPLFLCSDFGGSTGIASGSVGKIGRVSVLLLVMLANLLTVLLTLTWWFGKFFYYLRFNLDYMITAACLMPKTTHFQQTLHVVSPLKTHNALVICGVYSTTTALNCKI